MTRFSTKAISLVILALTAASTVSATTCECKKTYPIYSGLKGCEECFPSCYHYQPSKLTWICRPCSEGCQTCFNGTSCGICKPGYTIKRGQGVCQPCADEHCRNCFLEPNKCRQCITGYQLTMDGTCEAPPSIDTQ